MNIKIIFLVSVAFLNFALGATILTQDLKSKINRWFATFAFSLSFWSFSMMMYENTPEIWTNVFAWSLLLHLAGALIAHSFFYFSLVYPDEKISFNKFVQTLYYVPIFLIAYFLFVDKQIIVDLNFQNGVRNLTYGPVYFFYFSYFFMYMGGGLLILIYILFKFKGIQRKRISILLWSVIFPLTYSGIINMVLVAMGDFRYAWTGPIALFIVVASIAYGIIKYNFLDVKVIATQVFVIIISAITLIDIFSAKSTLDLIARISIFVITIIFAILLIKLVQTDVKRREQMEILSKDLRKVTKDLKTANVKLKRIDQAKLEFLSIASHQLRTPLTVIKGYVSMMLEGSFGKIPKLIKNNLTKVYAANDRLVVLVESLLNISRMEAGRLEFNISSNSLVLIIKPLINDYKQKAKAKKNQLEFVFAENISNVLIDPERIKEVIIHFIDNAIKYTNKGVIKINVYQQGDEVFFDCSDTGRGILVENISKIFNRFSQKNSGVSTFTESSGLDLYFSRMVVENLGGKIGVESAGSEKGSKFYFSLPIDKHVKSLSQPTNI